MTDHHAPQLQIMRASPAVAARLSSQPGFFARITERLSRAGGKAVVRLNLLRIVKLAFDAAPDRRAVASAPSLAPTVQRLAAEDPAVLVQRLAQELGREFGAVDSSLGALGGLGGGSKLVARAAEKRAKRASLQGAVGRAFGRFTGGGGGTGRSAGGEGGGGLSPEGSEGGGGPGSVPMGGGGGSHGALPMSPPRLLRKLGPKRTVSG